LRECAAAMLRPPVGLLTEGDRATKPVQRGHLLGGVVWFGVLFERCLDLFGRGEQAGADLGEYRGVVGAPLRGLGLGDGLVAVQRLDELALGLARLRARKQVPQAW